MLLNGVREGLGVILKNGVPFIQIGYHRGAVNGSVCRMDDYGVIELKGALINGMECGLFEEYDGNKKVVWRGYYRNGDRYSEVVASGVLDGYYDERSVESGLLMSTAQYDDSLHDKNGCCFEYENGSLKSECVYENGVKKHTVREFVDGKMVVFNSNAFGEKVYEGVYYGNMKSGFLCHEPMEGIDGFFKEVDSNGQLIAVSQYDELNVYRNGKCYEYEDERITQLCLYESGRLVEVIQEFNDSTMTENGILNYMGDMRNGFVGEGRGYELDENGRVKRVCLYEDGRMKRVVMEFEESTMIEYDEDGNRVYQGEYGGDMKNGFNRNGLGYCFNSDSTVDQYCVYEDGEEIRGIQSFWNSKMFEFGDNRRRRYMGGFTGDVKNGFKRNGLGYCCDENGTIKQYCVFENGVMKRVIQEFNGSTMTEFDENGKTIYEGEYNGGSDYGFNREGRGKEYGADGKTVIYSGQWRYGKRDGKGEEMNENGKVVFVGKWEGRKGNGKEVDENGNVVYEGEWNNGKRNGIGEEVCGSEMNSFGHWKDGEMKTGLFYERDEKQVIKRGCLYENGEMKRIVQEWEIYHLLLSRRIDSRIMHILNDFSFFISDTITGHVNGVFQFNWKYVSVDLLKGSSQVVIADMDNKKMTVYRDDEWMNTQCMIEVIDLDAGGRRWEGYVKDGKPFGYGVIYDEEGRRAFEGFILDGMKTCFGIEYYSDIDRVKYEGSYYFDDRFGKGILYGRNGAVDYNGLWKNNLPHSPSFNGISIDSQIESIDIPNNSFNRLDSFILSSFILSLKRIVIGDDCFESGRVFELDGLSELERVVIGKKSFTFDPTNVMNGEREDGVCRFVNCPKLRSIQIGDYSFRDYDSYELSNLPSLQSIDMGMNCFYWIRSFLLTGLID